MLQQDYLNTFFAGVPADELDGVLNGFERRSFSPGEVVVEEGRSPGEMYVVLSGTGDVFVTDRDSSERRVGRVVPGATLGEMALITGHPASATVRTTGRLEVLVLTEADVAGVTERYPCIYRNIGAILSERLVRSNRRSLEDRFGSLTILDDCGSPPLLGYALACSVAWHTRRSTLHIVICEGSVPDVLSDLPTSSPCPEPPFRQPVGSASPPAVGKKAEPARLMLVRPTGHFAPERFAETLEDLRHLYHHILVQSQGSDGPYGVSARHLRLLSSDAQRPEQREGSAYVIAGWLPAGGLARPDDRGGLCVPDLESPDHEGLRHGILQPATPAGRSLGWAARDIAGLKVGLALGAGSVKGYAHIGVLRALERSGVPVDVVAGTSIGAGVAAMRALQYTHEAMADVMDRVGGSAFRLGLPVLSLLSCTGLRSAIRTAFGEVRIEETPIPLAVMTADIETRREVAFRSGPLWPALMASMAIPGVYPPQCIGPHTLVDGGILNPVPSNVAAEMGGDRVIAVRLSDPPPRSRVSAAVHGATRRGPWAMQAITRSIEIMQSKITAETAGAATVLIDPAFTENTGLGLRKFSQGRRYIELGEAATEEALARISAVLPWVGN